jgi:hypothetical protein
MLKLRDYQVDIANKAKSTLAEHGMVYISAQVRTGKTLMSLETARLYGATNVLFLTKKKAISSIESDYNNFGYDKYFSLAVVNDESMHKITNPQVFDLIIHDEHHRCFLGETKIDGVNIKDIDAGSFQKSFNFAKGIYEYKKVLNVFKNPLTENLIKIKCNGKEIICTESHEIFTKRGWVKAGELLPTDELQVV